MTGWLARRVGHLLLVMFGASCLVFLLIHLIPGDPVEVMLGEHARMADREALRARLG
ncbi:MAG TPA: glutathione ABC transporter permease GsiC, partial [Chromatiaceae bacterium]|nr:glutathione ABC transporter permease GsiC [Chromatiaceae bacterium]